MKTSLFKKLTTDMESSFGTNYRGETDIRKVLDLSRLKDDLHGLIEEMVQQPAVYAYWANLKRIAEDNYNKYVDKMEVYKASKTKKVIEILMASGAKAPTGKLIEATFHREYRDETLYKKYKGFINLWRERKDTLTIIEKAVASRENQFKSLSYLMSNMMTTGLMTNKRLNPKTHKMEE